MKNNGKRNRQKGKRVEYLLRNHLRSVGFSNANRVPASGASQGFKGDVHATFGGKTYKFEVKSRGKYFNEIYANYNHFRSVVTGFAYETPTGWTTLYISDDILELIKDKESVGRALDNKEKKLKTRFENMKKWVKDCDYLVIKQNHKPFLFVWFYS